MKECGYVSSSTWSEFFLQPNNPTPLFPVEVPAGGITVENTTSGIDEFLKKYFCAGMLAEGCLYSMYNSFIDMYETEQKIKDNLDLTGAQLYWRTTDTGYEFMYGITAKTLKETTNYTVGWAEHGLMTSATNFNVESIYTQGNVSNITYYTTTEGPQGMAELTPAPASEEKTGYWKVGYVDKTTYTPQTFNLFVPYKDFGGKQNITIKEAPKP